MRDNEEVDEEGEEELSPLSVLLQLINYQSSGQVVGDRGREQLEECKAMLSIQKRVLLLFPESCRCQLQ